MSKLTALLKNGAMVQGAVGVGLSMAHSLAARGRRRTAVFTAVGLGLPFLAEYAGVNLFKAVRHHSQPQISGVPISAVFGWFNITYASYAMLESLLGKDGPAWRLPLATAGLATSLDLILDCFGLDEGMWEWQEGGPYANEIIGPNGKRGIPLLNYAGWLQLTSTVTVAYQWLARNIPAQGAGGSSGSGRQAALLLLPYYLGAAGWAVLTGRPKYLLYSAPVPATLLLALSKREQKSFRLA